MFYLNKPQIPSIQYQTMKKLFIEEGLEEQFLAFQHCSHNHFLRETLYQRQHGLCPYCGKPVIGTKINTRVHHNTYAHHCQYPGPEIKVHCPQSNGSISAKSPNCELCYYQHPKFAEACLERLSLLHDTCHQTLHEQR